MAVTGALRTAQRSAVASGAGLSSPVEPAPGARSPSRRAPSKTTPRVASTVTISPSRSLRVASPVPTTHGMPSSRETIAAWQVMPPESVTIAAARRISGSQSGEVMCVTSTSPSPRLAASVERGEHARGAAGAAGRPAEAAQQHRLRLRLLAMPWRRTPRLVVQRGDRAALQHPQRAVGVERPLGVLRSAVVLLDAPAELGDGDDLLVGEHRPQRLLLGEGALTGAAVGGVLDDQLLAVDLTAADRERRLLHHVAVRRDRAGDDGLAETEGALDHELVALRRWRG